MRAFLFPGQGSQAVGMGVALAGASRAARDVFDEVDEALGQNLFKIMRDGPDEELRLTENAQPAIMANSIAVFRTKVASPSSCSRHCRSAVSVDGRIESVAVMARAEARRGRAAECPRTDTRSRGSGEDPPG